MKQSLQLKFSQHLALTPQLQQSIRLLQLSTLELNQEIEQMLIENPLLERMDNPLESMVRLDSQGAMLAGASNSVSGDGQPAPNAGVAEGAPEHGAGESGGESAADRNSDDFGQDTDRDFDGAAGDIVVDWGADRRDRNDDDADHVRTQAAPAGRSLEAHLLEQLQALRCSRRDALMVELLIRELDDNGWLPRPVDALFDDLIDRLHQLRQPLEDAQQGRATAAGPDRTELGELLALLVRLAPPDFRAHDPACAQQLLGALLAHTATDLTVPLERSEMQAAANMLRSFDPAGVGARDLADCLALQLQRLPRRQWPSVHGWEAAYTIVTQHLPLLAARDWNRLRKVLQLGEDPEDEQTLRDAQSLIRSLQPLPAKDFASGEAGYVVPDVIVRRTRNSWTATLNPDVMPRLRVSDLYARILRRNKASGGLSTQLQEARWLVKNVQQRFDTILRVAQAIVERQREFFTHGEVAMRPLVLREIAEVLGLHESTVSRVTTQKYMLTPSGTFELKYFFGSHVATDTGGSASSTAIRALIRQLVAAEDNRQPLSDSRLADILGEQGIVVARRTVAKYRESLRIPAVTQRRAL